MLTAGKCDASCRLILENRPRWELTTGWPCARLRGGARPASCFEPLGFIADNVCARAKALMAKGE